MKLYSLFQSAECQTNTDMSRKFLLWCAGNILHAIVWYSIHISIVMIVNILISICISLLDLDFLKQLFSSNYIYIYIYTCIWHDMMYDMIAYEHGMIIWMNMKRIEYNMNITVYMYIYIHIIFIYIYMFMFIAYSYLYHIIYHIISCISLLLKSWFNNMNKYMNMNIIWIRI